MSTKEKDIEWVMNATGMTNKKARTALEKNNWQRERAIEEHLKPSEDITDIFGSSDEEEEEDKNEENNDQEKDESLEKSEDVQNEEEDNNNDDQNDDEDQDKPENDGDTSAELPHVSEDDDDDDDEDEDIISKKLKTDNDEDKDEDEDGEAALPDISDDESSDDDKRVNNQSSSMVYDFDIMMAKKKEENSRKRRRRNYDIINDNDDIIDDIIRQMKAAVDEDFQLNKNCMTATRKLKLLPFVVRQLRKVDLRDAFLDSGVLSVITDWLTPLPDRSLPHTNIRESLMKLLLEFNIHDTDKIKASGIGKAIMYLYKHPKETKENKQRARQLIGSWSRPIFQLDTSFSSMTREEREQRDLELKNKHRRSSGMMEEQLDSDSESEGQSRIRTTPQTSKAKDSTPQPPVASRPGEKGWIPRARVPQPSMKDYVIRPKSNIDAEVSSNSKKQMNMLDKYMRTQQERKRASRVQRAVNMKIDRA